MSSFLVIFFLIIIIIICIITSLIYFLGNTYQESWTVLSFENGVLRIYNKEQGVYEIHSENLIFNKESEYLPLFEIGNKIWVFGKELHFELCNVYMIQGNSLKLHFTKNELYKVIKSV